MIKACIIGISGYGRIHYDLLTAAQVAGEVEIVGATVINPDEEAEKCAHLRTLGCRIFDDYEAMLTALAGTAEFCMIPTGTPLHRPMTVAALEAGMHVLVEKPAAGCIEDVRAMQAVAKKAGRIVAVGYQHLYAPMAMATKQAIRDGRIGRVESIKCLVMWPRDHAYYSRNNWAGQLTVDGRRVNDSPFNNAVAHELMMMLFLAGSDERSAAMPVSVDARLYRANAIESSDTASMCIQTSEGVPIRFYATHACRDTHDPEIHVRGSRGSMIMTHTSSVISVEGEAPVTLPGAGSGEARKGMMSSVLDAVRGGSSLVCDLDLASRQTMVVSAIHDTCTIVPVKGETIAVQEDTLRTVIPGIEAAMIKACEEEQQLLLDFNKTTAKEVEVKSEPKTVASHTGVGDSPRRLGDSEEMAAI